MMTLTWRWPRAWYMFITTLVTALSNFTTLDASECLVGCTLLGLSPFDSNRVVEWSDRSACDDSAGCEVDTPSRLIYWVGCGTTDASRCLWAASSGTDGSSGCTCSVCGGSNTFASRYMEDEPLWTRIACYIADMEALGYDASICVAAAIDEGTMACVDEAYEVPTSYTQFECPGTGLGTGYMDDDVCAVSETTRKAEELFPAPGVTPAPSIADTPTPVRSGDPTAAPEADVMVSSPFPSWDESSPAPSAESSSLDVSTPRGSTDASTGSSTPGIEPVIEIVIGCFVALCCCGVVARVCCKREQQNGHNDEPRSRAIVGGAATAGAHDSAASGVVVVTRTRTRLSTVYSVSD